MIIIILILRVMLGWGAQTYWGPLWSTHGLVRVGSGLDSKLWTTVGHCPGSWSPTQLDVDGLSCSSLPVAVHTAPLHSYPSSLLFLIHYYYSWSVTCHLFKTFPPLWPHKGAVYIRPHHSSFFSIVTDKDLHGWKVLSSTCFTATCSLKNCPAIPML